MAIDLHGLDDKENWHGSRVIGFANDIFCDVGCFTLYEFDTTSDCGGAGATLREGLQATGDLYIRPNACLLGTEFTVTFVSSDVLGRGNKIVDFTGAKAHLAGDVGKMIWSNGSDTTVKIAVINAIWDDTCDPDQFFNSRGSPTGGPDKILMLSNQWGHVGGGGSTSVDEVVCISQPPTGGSYISFIANHSPNAGAGVWVRHFNIIGNAVAAQHQENNRVTYAFNNLENYRDRGPLFTDGHLESFLNIREYRLHGVEMRNTAGQDKALGRFSYDIWTGCFTENACNNFPILITNNAKTRTVNPILTTDPCCEVNWPPSTHDPCDVTDCSIYVDECCSSISQYNDFNISGYVGCMTDAQLQTAIENEAGWIDQITMTGTAVTCGVNCTTALETIILTRAIHCWGCLTACEKTTVLDSGVSTACRWDTVRASLTACDVGVVGKALTITLKCGTSLGCSAGCEQVHFVVPRSVLCNSARSGTCQTFTLTVAASGAVVPSIMQEGLYASYGGSSFG